MASCGECKKFFALKSDPKQGDCVQRVIDPRQGYYKAKPTRAKQDAQSCQEFEKR